jgi:phosphoserine phosphatase
MVNANQMHMPSFSQNEVINSIREASQNTPIIVDFDETLLLRNSTAEYLNSLQPRIVGSLLLKVIAFPKPWKWLTKSGEETKVRDWFLVFFTTLLMPWNIFFWKRIARDIAVKHSNYKLIEELNNNKDAEIIVATLGFTFIVNPILNNMSVTYSQLISCRFWQGLKDRQKGKLAIVEKSINEQQIASSIFITDSVDDLPLLKKTAKPLLFVWEKARYNYPMSDFYLPMMYIHKVKRVGEQYISKAILLDDFPILLLSLSWLSSQPILHGLGILFLLFSFWCIYEFGYYENDLIAEKYEKKPTLSNTYYNSQVTMNWWQPWIWALLLASIGIFALVGSEKTEVFNFTYLIKHQKEIATSYLILFGAWAGFLLISRFCFWIYNYVNKPTRIWLYFVLQFTRYCGFLAVTKTNLVGISLLLVQMLSRSISYLVYRYIGGNRENWPDLQEKFLRWFLFTFSIVGLSFAQTDIFLLINWQTVAIFTWYLLRGGHHIKRATNNFGLIQRDKIKDNRTKPKM